MSSKHYLHFAHKSNDETHWTSTRARRWRKQQQQQLERKKSSQVHRDSLGSGFYFWWRKKTSRKYLKALLIEKLYGAQTIHCRKTKTNFFFRSLSLSHPSSFFMWCFLSAEKYFMSLECVGYFFLFCRLIFPKETFPKLIWTGELRTVNDRKNRDKIHIFHSIQRLVCKFKENLFLQVLFSLAL